MKKFKSFHFLRNHMSQKNQYVVFNFLTTIKSDNGTITNFKF